MYKVQQDVKQALVCKHLEWPLVAGLFMHYSREHGNSLSVPVSAKTTDSLSPVIAPTLNHSTSVKWKYQRIYLMEFDND